MLWKSIVLTILICSLFVLGASSFIAERTDSGEDIEPVGTIAAGPDDTPVDFGKWYREWRGLP